jgi:CxxC motif-containing protein (DUF1111 family)
MKSASPFLASSLVVCAVVAANVVQSSAAGRNGAGRSALGKPIDGISRAEREQFMEGREAFSETEDEGDGLGPLFNERSCAACHSDPAVGGGGSISETRAQHVDGGTGARFELEGGSLFQTFAIRPDCQETVPSNANVTALRQTTPLFGLGLVEAIPDAQIEDYAAEQAARFPQQAGRVLRVLDLASGRSLVGRLGWKNQHATLLSFAADAYLNEMGITSPTQPDENAPNGDATRLAACDAVSDPEDQGDDVVAFANFMRLLAPPAGTEDCDRPGHRHHSNGRSGRSRTAQGERVFERIGCAVCHSVGYTASSPIAAINGDNVDAYSDFLLHDVGTGDGIEQGGAGANELRTTPLWGVSASGPWLHDGSAATIREAILRHANQGAAARQAFQNSSPWDQRALLLFLGTI